MSELTTREQEVWRLEGEIIDAWLAADEKVPRAAFVALLSGLRTACEPVLNQQAAADRALDRLRRVAEVMKP